jgi:hypothetical protein
MLRHPVLGALILPFVLYFSPWRYERYILTYVGRWHYFLDPLSDPRVRPAALSVVMQAVLSIAIYTALMIVLSLLLIPNAKLEYYLIGILIQPVMVILIMITHGFSADFVLGMLFVLGTGGYLGITLTFLLGGYRTVPGSPELGTFVDSLGGQLFISTGLMITLGMMSRLLFGIMQRDSRYSQTIGYVILLLFVGIVGFAAKTELPDLYYVGTIVLMMTYSGLWLLPFQVVIAAVIGIQVMIDPARASRLWPFTPTAWDQFFLLPTPDVSLILRTLYRLDRDNFHEFARACEHQFSGVFWNRTIQRTQREG